MSEPTTAGAFPALAGAEFMMLTTYRRDGRPVGTTVWFAQAGDRLYVTTMAGTGKAKRVRATPQVTVAPATQTGLVLDPVAPGRARVLDPEAFPTAEAALRQKYPAFAQIVGRSDGADGASGRIYLEIVPEGA